MQFKAKSTYNGNIFDKLKELNFPMTDLLPLTLDAIARLSERTGKSSISTLGYIQSSILPLGAEPILDNEPLSYLLNMKNDNVSQSVVNFYQKSGLKNSVLSSRIAIMLATIAPYINYSFITLIDILDSLDGSQVKLNDTVVDTERFVTTRKRKVRVSKPTQSSPTATTSRVLVDDEDDDDDDELPTIKRVETEIKIVPKDVLTPEEKAFLESQKREEALEHQREEERKRQLAEEEKKAASSDGIRKNPSLGAFL